MSVGKAVEWVIIAAVAVIGGRYLLGLLESATNTPTSPQMQDPAAAPFIGWPYGTGVVYLSPGIVGPQWGGPGGGEFPYGVPGTPSDPWVGPGAPPQSYGVGGSGGPVSRRPKANPVRGNRTPLNA